MIQHSSNHGSQTAKLLIQAINLGIKLLLLQKGRVYGVLGCMLMIWVVFAMGEIYQET